MLGSYMPAWLQNKLDRKDWGEKKHKGVSSNSALRGDSSQTIITAFFIGNNKKLNSIHFKLIREFTDFVNYMSKGQSWLKKCLSNVLRICLCITLLCVLYGKYFLKWSSSGTNTPLRVRGLPGLTTTEKDL